MTNKKKIACFALASALIIPCAVGLTGCQDKHTHAFNSDPYYEVVLEGETKVARSWRKCSCGAEDAHKKVDNAIIVSSDETAENYVQKVLDSNIDNKIIVFDEGTYGEIRIRATAETSTVYSVASEDAVGELVTGELEGAGTSYHYFRTLQNVTFAGTKDSKFSARFTLHSTKVQYVADGYSFDAVRNLTYTKLADGKNFEHISMSNIQLTRMSFEGKDAIFYTYNTLDDIVVDGFKVTSCSFIREPEATRTPAAFQVWSQANNRWRNVEFTNNKVDGHYQGLNIQNATNIKILNNEVSNTDHNAFAIQAYDNSGDYYFSGDIIIKNNKISNTSDRAIRFAVGNNANIVVENNTFDNCVDGTSLLKTEISTNTTYSFKNNTYAGNALENENGTLNNANWEVVIE